MTKIGTKVRMDIEHFHHRQTVILRKREVEKVIMDRELWLEKDDFKPIAVVIPKRKRKSLLELLLEVRP